MNKELNNPNDIEIQKLKIRIERLEKEIHEKDSTIRKYKYDYLTNFMGRADFQERLSEFWYEYETFNHHFILAIIDINGLHDINRTKGYDAGDEMIIDVSLSIKSLFEDSNLFRIGGDEFAILKRGSYIDSFDERLQKIPNVTAKATLSIMKFSSGSSMFKYLDEIVTDLKNGR